MENTKNDWLLDSLNINRGWQNNQPYTGNIKFRNGVKMEFTLLLDTEKCGKIIHILQDELTASAQRLGEMMVQSMPIAIQEKSESSNTP